MGLGKGLGVMKILSVDSSSQVLSAACVRFENKAGHDEHEILFRRDIPHARADSTALFVTLEQALRECGLPEALVIGLGPGSYNGLRASISTLRAMATSLAIPLHAVPSPLALPLDAPEFLAAGDARGGSFWAARISGDAFLREPSLISPAELALLLEQDPSLPITGPSDLPGIPGLRASTPDAVRLAIVARSNDPFYVCTSTPEPLYLKPPHITEPRKPHVTA